MRIVMTIAALVAAISSIPAFGQQADADPVVHVQVADLDLRSDAGRRQLARRVGRAAESVCGSYFDVREHAEIERIDQCRRSAMTKAKEQVAALAREQQTRSASR